jgi:hypothetical protein
VLTPRIKLREVAFTGHYEDEYVEYLERVCWCLCFSRVKLTTCTYV